MQTGIMRLSEGGTPVGMSPKMAADFVSWFVSTFGRDALGPQSWQAAKPLWLKESGYKTYGDSLKDYFPEADWSTYVNWVTSGQWSDTTDTEEEKTPDPQTGATEPIVLMDGASLPDASNYPEGQIANIGDAVYVILNGEWAKVSPDARQPNDGGGLFGLGIGPWLSDLFGATGTGWGNVLSGIFGQGGNIKDLIDLFLKGKMVKGAWDAIEYEVPTGQKESMSAFEKANPFTGNTTLAGIRPSYLQNQKYAIPVGQSGIPAATHTVGTPFVEKVEEVQGGEMGGIMGAKGHGDIVPALLEPNEFVFTRKAVQNMGNGNVNLGAKRMYKIMKDLERMG